MDRLNTSADIPLSGGRRIYNVGGHGGGGIGNASINQRMLDGIDLNTSIGAKRYDQHFDSQFSNDHSIENYSSRQNYATGVPDLRESMLNLKRSETENIKGSVTFANALHRVNHPMHYKQFDMLERIDENKTPSQRPKSSSKYNQHGSIKLN